MEKLLLLTTVAFATMAAAPAASVQPALASAQPAAAPPGGDAPATNTAPAAEEKKVCKALPSSGTRFSKKACLTAKEWKQVQADVESDNGF